MMPGMITETIRFADLLDATKVEIDEWCSDAPWDTCDGYEHALFQAESVEGVAHDYRGYCSPRGYSYHPVIVTVATGDYWGVAAYAHSRGASKQVAAELCARNKQRTIDQLVDWRNNGWEWYYVMCEYRGHVESVGGIESAEYAEEMRGEIAGQMAYQLTKQGYIVTDQPSDTGPTREDRRRRFRDNINSQNWTN